MYTYIYIYIYIYMENGYGSLAVIKELFILYI